MIDEKTLTKGQLRKLNALRKSVGDKIGDVAFSEWLKTQATAKVQKTDDVAEKIVEALSQYADDKSFRLGRRGYVVRRAKGKGAKGFVAEKIDQSLLHLTVRNDNNLHATHLVLFSGRYLTFTTMWRNVLTSIQQFWGLR